MKIILIQNITYVPGHGGETKCNQELLEGLVKENFLCRVIAPATGVHGPSNMDELIAALDSRHIDFSKSSEGVHFSKGGVTVNALFDFSRIHEILIKELREWEPDWLVVSSNDPGQGLLALALKLYPSRVVYLAHTVQILPCGNESFFPGKSNTELLKLTAGIICTSRYLADYIEKWAGVPAAAIYFPVYGKGHFPMLANFKSPYISMVNPCSYKGIDILIKLADENSHLDFAVIPTWGTTSDDQRMLECRSNIRILKPLDNMDDLFRITKVMLVPSLWQETFGVIIVEAMLRGIPVIASNVGGIKEAKLGVDYLLPVSPIKSYTNELDERLKPNAIVPLQDITSWQHALEKLTNDPDHYQSLSQESYKRAAEFHCNTLINPFVSFFKNLKPGTCKHIKHEEAANSIRNNNIEETGSLLLSPGKRALLLKLLKKNKQVTTAGE